MTRALAHGLSLAALATLCGLAFNAANPVGLRWRGQAADSASAGVYGHEMLFFHPAGPAAAPEAGSPGPYRNETVAVQPFTVGPAPAPEVGIRATTWAEVADAVAAGRAVLVDSRPAAAYEAGHIPGAVSLPFATLEAGIGAFRARVTPETPLAVYCGDSDCALAATLARELVQRHGYRDVAYLPGGYLEWVREQNAGK